MENTTIWIRHWKWPWWLKFIYHSKRFLWCSWLHRRCKCYPAVWRTCDGIWNWHCEKCHECGEEIDRLMYHMTKLNEKFEKLADEWENGTIHMSNSRSMMKHHAFQELLDMGKYIIPLAMERMKEGSVFWFLVLERLVDNPPDCRVQGDMKELRKRWLEWDKRRT